MADVVSVLLAIALAASSPVPKGAQPSNEGNVGAGEGPAWDR